MKLRTRLAAAAAVLIGASAPIVGPAPASAANTYITVYTSSGCPAGYYCAWPRVDGSNQKGVGFYLDAWDYASIPTAYRWINNASAQWVNHGVSTYSSVRLFDYAGGSGTNKCLKKGYAVFGDTTSPTLNNRVSAHVWVSSCSGYTQFARQEKVY